MKTQICALLTSSHVKSISAAMLAMESSPVLKRIAGNRLRDYQSRRATLPTLLGFENITEEEVEKARGASVEASRVDVDMTRGDSVASHKEAKLASSSGSQQTSSLSTHTRNRQAGAETACSMVYLKGLP